MNRKLFPLVVSSLCIALGILIPIISPVKIIIEPMSFTLASHVAIMIAMFISPGCAVSVAFGTTLGFLLAGIFPLPVILRALSHVVWAYFGAVYLKKHPKAMQSFKAIIVFAATIAILHSLCEILVVLPLYVSQTTHSLFQLLFGFIGLGTFIHSLIDFALSVLVWKLICNQRNIKSISSIMEINFKKKVNKQIMND